MRDCLVEYCALRELPRPDDVGDGAVDEDVAWLEVEQCRFWDAGVRAAEPEDLRSLFFGELREEVGVLSVDLGGPGFVVD